MLHGFTASAKINWLDSGWIAALTALGRRVIALDARGHGKSDKPHNSAYYPANIMMEDSIALMRQLGFPQADYAGFSMGARMSAFAAIHYPNKVRKLLLGGMGINLKMGAGLPEPIADALLVDDPATIRSRHARRFRRLAEKCGNDLTALAHCILSERRQITADCLAKIRANTLILVGDQDDTGGSPYDLMPYIPDSQAIEIDNCSHFNALTHDVFRQAGIAFLQSSTKK
ncbi:MAG: alpha/beta hydrolase [Gammaproteobacteria bacterium]|nr:MAG: alpha/beta hydrolase [Gammaproteobacteria bacterium]